jgi:hypothetical protein
MRTEYYIQVGDHLIHVKEGGHWNAYNAYARWCRETTNPNSQWWGHAVKLLEYGDGRVLASQPGAIEYCI